MRKRTEDKLCELAFLNQRDRVQRWTKGGPVLLSNSQARPGRNFSQPFSEALCWEQPVGNVQNFWATPQISSLRGLNDGVVFPTTKIRKPVYKRRFQLHPGARTFFVVCCVCVTFSRTVVDGCWFKGAMTGQKCLMRPLHLSSITLTRTVVITYINVCHVQIG